MADQEFGLPLIGGQAQVPMRRCRVCRESKPYEEFEHREYGRRRDRCKVCANAARDPIKNRRRVKEWQQANPEKKRAASRRNYDNRRTDVTRWIASNLRTTRATCKKRDIPCTVTAIELTAVYEAQAGKCAITGRVMLIGSKGQQRDSLSIDRIEPAGGYVLGNVRLVTYQANMARGMFSDEELYAFCEAALRNRGFLDEAAE
jgi:hypothetical protein